MPFLTRTTFDYRRAVMGRMMHAGGFDALAFTAPDFFQWASNFHVDVQTWERPIVAVVPLDGEPFAVMNELSTNHVRGARERGVMWVDDEAGAEAAVAGNPVSAIDAAAQSVIVKAGYGENILHRTGHGMGVQGHEYPDDMPFCHRPLLAGEVFSVEPGIYVYGLGGFRLDDTVVIGAKPELITKAPRDIKSNTIL